MEPLDAVVLAGGRSDRLAGVVPPHHKPFIVVNGHSLVLNAIHLAYAARAERIIVVTCPEITLPLAQLVDTLEPEIRARVIITVHAQGVGPALWYGATLAQNPRLLVLMADNVMSLEDVNLVSNERYAVGVRQMSTLDAYRFTRWVRGRWVEDSVSAAESDLTQVWCGPLILSRDCVLRYSDMLPGGKIGRNLDNLVPDPADLVRVPVECVDIGTPNVLKKMTGGSA